MKDLHNERGAALSKCVSGSAAIRALLSVTTTRAITVVDPPQYTPLMYPPCTSRAPAWNNGVEVDRHPHTHTHGVSLSGCGRDEVSTDLHGDTHLILGSSSSVRWQIQHILHNHTV